MRIFFPLSGVMSTYEPVACMLAWHKQKVVFSAISLNVMNLFQRFFLKFLLPVFSSSMSVASFCPSWTLIPPFITFLLFFPIKPLGQVAKSEAVLNFFFHKDCVHNECMTIVRLTHSSFDPIYMFVLLKMCINAFCITLTVVLWGAIEVLPRYRTKC